MHVFFLVDRIKELAAKDPSMTERLPFFDDREVKVQNIGLHIGRRPILELGNSDGDLAMLRYTKTGKRSFPNSTNGV